MPDHAVTIPLIAIAIQGAAASINRADSGPMEPEYATNIPANRVRSLPLISRDDWNEEELRDRRLAELSLLPVRRYRDVLRYEIGRVRYGGNSPFVIIQLVTAYDLSRAQLLVVEAEAGLTAVPLRREVRWVSMDAYHSTLRSVLRDADYVETIFPTRRQNDCLRSRALEPARRVAWRLDRAGDSAFGVLW